MIDRLPLGRKEHEMRPLQFEANVSAYAEGSVLIQAGQTKVLCTASIEESVPKWLAGKGQGWISAEYSMLPRATHTRGKRDREKVSGRTQEIQRLIGRALRSSIDLKFLGERSIIVDCDVLQADGGTRTASISGGCVALGLALKKLILQGKLPSTVWSQLWKNTVSAMSVGLREGQVLVDLDYQEDSSCDVDMNFVMTGGGEFVEIQGTGEQRAFTQDDFLRMMAVATQACEQIRDLQKKILI
jgi:ribonuclease PH